MDRYQQHSPAACILGVDFGAAALVAGYIGTGDTRYRPLKLAGLAQDLPGPEETVAAVPALLHYDGNGAAMVGDGVVRAGLTGDMATARWIRDYFLEGSAVQVPAGPDRRVTYREAAADYLSAIFARAIRECGCRPSAVFSVPAGAPAWYAGWLAGIAHSAGFTACHTMDEYSAAAAGYGLTVEEGQAFIILQFDETGLVVTLVRRALDGMHPLGEARDDTGCRAFDSWIVQDILARGNVRPAGPRAERITAIVMARIGEIHAQLATGAGAALEIADPVSGTVLPVRISPEDSRRILAEHGFPAILDRVAGRALAAAHERGSGEETPAAVLLLGRGCLHPAVQRCIRERFTGIPVRADHPVDALARGAASTASAGKRTDRIGNDYAIRYWDAATREHRYRFLVHGGARYPSAGQVARITISAAYEGQTRLGIPLYEISAAPGAGTPALELVSDPAGGVRVAGPSGNAGEGSRPVLVNGRTPTLLPADPPALKGEPRFELTFTLDRERQLCVTARDLVTGTLVKKDAPVHRLT
jgi:molecular chaperone DnaK (HSP70)